MNCPHCGKEIFDMGLTISEIRHNPKIPEGAKNIMIPMLQKIKALERNVMEVERAYRRGKQEGEESNPDV